MHCNCCFEVKFRRGPIILNQKYIAISDYVKHHCTFSGFCLEAAQRSCAGALSLSFDLLNHFIITIDMSLFKHVWLTSSDMPPDPSLSQSLLEGTKQEEMHALPKLEKCELRIEGMTCGACVEVNKVFVKSPANLTPCLQSIEGMLRNQEGIHSIKVALLAERAVVEFDPVQWTVEKLIDVSSSELQSSP